MRFQRATASLLGIAALASPIVANASSPSRDDRPQTTPSSASSGLFPLLTWARDGAVELLFGRPPKKTDTGTARAPIPSLKKYAGEVVLRFNITTPDEEHALAESAERLFLDVWAVTHDFVDIRLRKDRIAPLLRLLPDSLHDAHRTLIPDVGAAVYGTYPSSADAGRTLPLSEEGATLLRPLSDDSDNVFFRDYRPMSVCASHPLPDAIEDCAVLTRLGNRSLDEANGSHVPFDCARHLRRNILRGQRHPGPEIGRCTVRRECSSQEDTRHHSRAACPRMDLDHNGELRRLVLRHQLWQGAHDHKVPRAFRCSFHPRHESRWSRIHLGGR